MRKTVPENTTTPKMPGKDSYTMIMDQKLSEDLARRGGIGLQKVLYEQLKQRPQEAVKPEEVTGADPEAAAKKTLKTD
jgi:Rod binding domain-containing protein